MPLLLKKRVFILLLLTVFLSTTQAFAGGPFNFTQENWSGGSTQSRAADPANQTGWNEYTSKDNNVSVINAGADLTVSQSTLSWLQTDDSATLSGFNATGSILSGMEVTGAGTGAGLSLLDSGAGFTSGNYESAIFDTAQTSNVSSIAWTVLNETGSILFDYDLTDSGFLSSFNANNVIIDSTGIRIAPPLPVTPPIPLTPDLSTKALWHFDDVANPALDSSANNNNGTITGATLAVSGKMNGALSFAGSDYITVPNSASVDVQGALTISAWVNISNINKSYQTIVSKFDYINGVRGYYLGFDLIPRVCPGELIFTVSSTGNNSGEKIICSSGAGITQNQWYHIVAVFAPGSYMKIYVNGADVTDPAFTPQSNIPNSIVSNGLNLLIGKDYKVTDTFLVGSLDDLAIFDRALTVVEVNNIFGVAATPTTSTFITTEYTAFSATGWAAFTPTIIEDGVTTLATYQLSNDSGLTWQHWNGAAWVEDIGNLFSTKADVVGNFASFPPNAIGEYKLQIKVLLQTYSSIASPVINNIRVSYNHDIGTSNVIMQVGAGNSINENDGSWTWQTVNSGDSFAAAKRYLKYKTSMSTPALTVSPVIADVTIEYQHEITNAAVLISSPYNSNSIATNWNSLSWLETVPGASTVKFQIRTAEEVAGVPNWQAGIGWAGPDGTANSFFTSAAAGCSGVAGQVTCLIPPVFQIDTLQSNIWGQYKAIMNSDGVNHPVLHNSVISYSFRTFGLSFTPGTAINSADSVIEIIGVEMTGALGVSFNAVPPISLPIIPGSVTDTGLSVTLPAGTATGSYNIMLTSSEETSVVGNSQFNLAGQPTVTSSLPAIASLAAGGNITISGDGFTLASEVNVVGAATTPVVSFTVDDDNTISAVLPAALSTGAYTIQVVTPGGLSGAGDGGFTIVDISQVDTITPQQYDNSSFADVTITGTGFTLASEVRLDDINNTLLLNQVFVDDSTITGRIPAGVATGTYNIIVTTPAGNNTTSSVTFSSTALPILASVLPPTAVSSQNALITIIGNHLTLGQASITGPAPVVLNNVVVVDDSTITANIPSGLSTGVYTITVTTPLGSGSAGQVDFTVVEIAVVDSISPVLYDNSSFADVTILGSSFTLASEVRLDDINNTLLTNLTFVDATTITGRVPAGIATGEYNVVVTTPPGNNSLSNMQFSSTAIPVANSVTPTIAQQSTNTLITITGDQLTGTSGVRLNDPAATELTGITVVDDATLQVTVPGGVDSGAYTLFVRTGVGEALSGPQVNIAADIAFIPATIGAGATGRPVSAVWPFVESGTTDNIDAGWSVTQLERTVLPNDRIDYLIDISPNAIPGPITVTFNSPTSNSTFAGSFVITPKPSMTSIAPQSAYQGEQGITFDIFVSGMQSGVTLEFDDAGITLETLEEVTSEHLVAVISFNASTAAGIRRITIINPDGGRSTSWIEVNETPNESIAPAQISSLTTGLVELSFDMNIDPAGLSNAANMEIVNGNLQLIQDYPVLDGDTAALWHFNETSGTLVMDASPFKNTLGFSGAVTRSAGAMGNGVTLNGATALGALDSASLDISGPMTIMGWLNISDINKSFQSIVSKFDFPNNQRGYYLGYNIAAIGCANQLIFTISSTGDSSGEKIMCSNTTIFQDQWYHFAAVYIPGTSMKIYLNGNDVTDGTRSQVGTPTSIFRNNSSLLIGRDHSAGDTNFRGSIDEVAIYSRAVPGNEIALTVQNTLTNNFSPEETALSDVKTVTTTVDSWSFFKETSIIPAGSSIGYQLYDTTDATWKYYDTTSLLWVAAGAGNYNSATVINSNIRSFSNPPPGGVMQFKVRLTSDGAQTPVLNSVQIGYESDSQHITTNSIQLNWVAPGNDISVGAADGYDIRYVENNPILTDADFNVATGVFNSVVPLSAGAIESYSVDNLTPGTQYCFAIKAFDLSGNIATLSNSPCAATIAISGVVDTLSPDPVTGLRSGFASDDTIKLQWNATGDDAGVGTAFSYIVKRSFVEIMENGTSDGQFSVDFDNATDVPNTMIPQLAGSSETLFIANLTSSDRKYHFAIKAVDEAGNQSLLTGVMVRTAVSDTISPAPVADLGAFWSDLSSALITWSATGDDEINGLATSYDLRFSRTPILNETDFNNAATAVNLPSPPAAQGTLESYTLTGLLSDSTYFIAIKAIDEAGNGSTFEVISVSTLIDTVKPAVVSDLRGGLISNDAIELRWTAPGDDADAGQASFYDIKYSFLPIMENGTASGAGEVDFNNAWSLPNNIVPSFAGSLESIIVRETHFAESGNLTAEFNFNDPSLYTVGNGAGVATGSATLRRGGTIIADAATKGLWHFNNSALPGFDDSSNNNDGFIAGASWTGSGALDGAMSFNGATDLIRVTNSETLNISGALTISSWINTGDITKSYQSIVSKFDFSSNQRGYFLGYNIAPTVCANQLTFIISSTGNVSGEKIVCSSAEILQNQWYHVAAVFIPGESMRIYVNGADVTDPASENTLNVPIRVFRNSKDLLIAKDHFAGSNTMFSGSIDEVALFARGLSQAEITAAANSTVNYVTTEPVVVTPSWSSALVTGWSGFSTVQNTPAGTSIMYQISNDDGVSWKYWNSVAWVVASSDPLLQEYNNVATINLHMPTFLPVTADGVKVRAFMKTTDSTVTPTIDTIGVGYDFQLASTLSPNTTFYFAIKTIDEAGNVSDLNSNNPVAITTGITDIIAPSPITDLVSAFDAANNMNLTWSAPGDDRTKGQANSYQIRYSETPITELNFTAATEVVSPPLPQVGGSSEAFAVTGFDICTNYYVAIITSDEAGNVSGISNSTVTTCLVDNLPPATIGSTAIQSQDTDSITIGWLATGDDGTIGRATDYDVRYSTSPIADEAAFTAAQLVTGLPSPLDSGASETFRVWPLASSTTYYISVKAIDDAGNASALGNVVSTTTTLDQGFPAIIDSFTADPTSVTANNITLSWSATGDDTNIGVATSYDIRYSNSPIITSADFANADIIEHSITPQPPLDGTGSPNIETLTVDRNNLGLFYLDSNTTYYFAITATDDAGRTSPMKVCSNCPVRTALHLGYNMVSAPGVLATNTPDSLFGNEVGSSRLIVKEWISEGLLTGRWNEVVSTISINAGSGYLFYINSPGVVLDAPADITPVGSATFEQPISAGWNIISNPYTTTVTLSDVMVQQVGSLPVSFRIAVENGWVGNAMYTTNGNTYDVSMFNGTSAAKLVPWRGYWFEVLDDLNDYVIILPTP